MPERAPLALGLVLLAAVATSVLAVDYLPTHDGPQHIFTAHAANHLDDPDTGWSEWLRPNLPVSNHGWSAVFSPFDRALSWQAATKAALVLMTACWVLGALALARALHPARTWLGVALGAGALQWTLYMGFFSFYVSSALGLFIVTWALHSRRRGVLALLLFLQALLHLMAAAVTSVAVAALLLLRASPGSRLRELVRVAAVGAPAAGLALATVLVHGLAGAGAVPDPETAWSPAPAPWWALGKCFLGGPAWRAWPLSLLAVAAPCVALASRGRSPQDRALLLAGGVLLLAGAALPLHLPSWDFFSVRFLPLATCALVVTLPLERLAPGSRRLVGAALAAFAFAATAWAFQYHRSLAEQSEGALAGLEAPLRRDGPRLPIVLDPYLGRPYEEARADMPFAVPLLNLGKLYAASQGGVVPYAFTSDPAIHVVLANDEQAHALPPAADPRYAVGLFEPAHATDLAMREAMTVYMAAHGTRYQDVILWGHPQDADHLEWLGFAPDWRRAGLTIARFVGCPLEVRISPGAAFDTNAVLELGWFPAHGVTHRYSLDRATRADDGTFVLPMRQSCGAVWIGFAQADLACEGADPDGRLVIRSTRATPEVECRLRGTTPERYTERGR